MLIVSRLRDVEDNLRPSGINRKAHISITLTPVWCVLSAKSRIAVKLPPHYPYVRLKTAHSRVILRYCDDDLRTRQGIHEC